MSMLSISHFICLIFMISSQLSTALVEDVKKIERFLNLSHTEGCDTGHFFKFYPKFQEPKERAIVTPIFWFGQEKHQPENGIQNVRINNYRLKWSNNSSLNDADAYDFVVVVPYLTPRYKINEFVSMGVKVVQVNMGRFGESTDFSRAFVRWSFLALCWYKEVLFIDNIYTVIGQLGDYATSLKQKNNMRYFYDQNITFVFASPKPELFHHIMSKNNFYKFAMRAVFKEYMANADQLPTPPDSILQKRGLPNVVCRLPQWWFSTLRDVEEFEWKDKLDSSNSSIREAKHTGIERILILTYENRPGNNNDSLSSIESYARKHGYDFHLDRIVYNINGRRQEWQKTLSLTSALQNFTSMYDWIWWLDSDLIIMNGQLSVQDHILTRTLQQRLMRGLDMSNCNLIMSTDACDLNTGSFLLRPGSWASALLRQTWHSLDLQIADQSAMNAVLRDDSFRRDYLEVVPNYLLNSYANGQIGLPYRKGDLLIHFAGVDKKELRMTQFIKESKFAGS